MDADLTVGRGTVYLQAFLHRTGKGVLGRAGLSLNFVAWEPHGSEPLATPLVTVIATGFR